MFESWVLLVAGANVGICNRGRSPAEPVCSSDYAHVPSQTFHIRGCFAAQGHPKVHLYITFESLGCAFCGGQLSQRA